MVMKEFLHVWEPFGNSVFRRRKAVIWQWYLGKVHMPLVDTLVSGKTREKHKSEIRADQHRVVSSMEWFPQSSKLKKMRAILCMCVWTLLIFGSRICISGRILVYTLYSIFFFTPNLSCDFHHLYAMIREKNDDFISQCEQQANPC